MPCLVTHSLKPIYNAESKVLILGSIPSPKSRQYRFYYSHPQNKFWRIMADLFDASLPQTNAQKEALILCRGVALFDVLQSCQIDGADDSSIQDPIANNLTPILSAANIKAIFTTGTKATALYKKHCSPSTNMPSIYLPSTSPANCRFYSYEDLLKHYRVLLDYLT